jgi:hypothetical protein
VFLFSLPVNDYDIDDPTFRVLLAMRLLQPISSREVAHCPCDHKYKQWATDWHLEGCNMGHLNTTSPIHARHSAANNTLQKHLSSLGIKTAREQHLDGSERPGDVSAYGVGGIYGNLVYVDMTSASFSSNTSRGSVPDDTLPFWVDLDPAKSPQSYALCDIAESFKTTPAVRALFAKPQHRHIFQLPGGFTSRGRFSRGVELFYRRLAEIGARRDTTDGAARVQGLWASLLGELSTVVQVETAKCIVDRLPSLDSVVNANRPRLSISSPIARPKIGLRGSSKTRSHDEALVSGNPLIRTQSLPSSSVATDQGIRAMSRPASLISLVQITNAQAADELNDSDEYDRDVMTSIFSSPTQPDGY